MYRIMIVDDEPFIIEGLKALIDWELYGFQVCCEATNGLEALENAKYMNIDLIVTDIRMPEMDGLNFIQLCIEELKGKCKFIVLSGFSDFEYAKKALSLGVESYILKPVEEDEIIESLISIKEKLDLENQERTYNYKVILNDVIKQYINREVNETALDKLKEYIPNFQDGNYNYLIVKKLESDNIDEYKKSNRRDIFNGIKNIISEIIGMDEHMFNSIDNVSYGFVITQRHLVEYGGSILIAADMIIRRIKEKLHEDVSVYIGKRVNGIKQIREAYETCIIALKSNCKSSNNRIISYDNILNAESNYNFEDNPGFDLLLEEVELNNKNGIINNIEKIFIKAHEALYAPDVIKGSIAAFQMDILKLIEEMNGNSNDILDFFKKVKLDIMDIDDIKKELVNSCICVAEYISILRKDRKSGVIYEVQKYIDDNYYLDLSLKKLAEKFNVNPIYLGQIFIRNYKITFNEYINQLRIKNAQQLLINEDQRITEIANIVGYNNFCYFNNKFKKITNTTPIKYRDSYRKAKEATNIKNELT